MKTFLQKFPNSKWIFGAVVASSISTVLCYQWMSWRESQARERVADVYVESPMVRAMRTVLRIDPKWQYVEISRLPPGVELHSKVYLDLSAGSYEQMMRGEFAVISWNGDDETCYSFLRSWETVPGDPNLFQRLKETSGAVVYYPLGPPDPLQKSPP